MSKVNAVLKSLKMNKHFSQRVSHIWQNSPVDAVYGPIPQDLDPKIVSYLQENNISLYSHQAEGIKRCLAGENIIVTTPTASGKTMIFNLSVLNSMIKNKKARAMYIYPRKALANDQMKSVLALEKALEIKVNPAIYDGDTPQSQRGTIRFRSRLIMTNPHELHHCLGTHYKWKKEFWENLEYIIIDEAHMYRGVFGSHIALLLRRIKRICNWYGGKPKFVLSSATIANALQFAEKLTQEDSFSLIDKSGAPESLKHFALYNPFMEDLEYYLSSSNETLRLFHLSVTQGLQTLCFVGSRKMAELITYFSKGSLNKKNLADLADKVIAYKAGYTPGERREIEQSLKKGDLRGVVSTNALELGIDIGSLDAVILAGYPGTISSTWQQAGRCGRGKEDSLAILIAMEDPLDQYIMKNPETIFGANVEKAIIDERNPHILFGHILCASAEMPIKVERDYPYFCRNEDELMEILEALHHQYLVSPTPRGWVYSGKTRAPELVSLTDSDMNSSFKVICNGVVLETIERDKVYDEAHPNAVWIHMGQQYLVKEVNESLQAITVMRKDVDYYTKTMKEISVSNIKEEERIVYSDKHYSLCKGTLTVTKHILGYKVIKDDQVLEIHNEEFPSTSIDTTGMWIEFENGFAGLKNKDESVFYSGLVGIEHALLGISPLFIMCDRRDIDGKTSAMHPETKTPAIFIFDNFDGGIGLTDALYITFDDVFEKAAYIVNNCKCKDGCPGCLYLPQRKEENMSINKEVTKRFMNFMLKPSVH